MRIRTSHTLNHFNIESQKRGTDVILGKELEVLDLYTLTQCVGTEVLFAFSS